ncbi:MAG: SDR family oxidoreductase [Candidatus Hydrogenedentes bacterium]|nr:SDR family oxidoreductase [Candidatus Hydrogenedentota bacterium]
MRILIAGCGYVGAELARQLAEQGHTVFGLRRNTAQLPSGIEPVTADLAIPGSLAVIPKSLDYVFYTSSASGYSESAYSAAYVSGLRNLLAALYRQSDLKRIFYTSSTGVYSQDDGTWLDESSPTPSDRFSARILLEGEREVRDARIPGTVVRFSGIYGPERTRLIDSVANGSARLEPGPDRYLNHIHRDDCAGCLAHLMVLPNPAPLYLATDDEPRTRNDLLRWIAKQLDMPEPPMMKESPEEARPSERGGNRRYRNALLRASGYSFKYPTFREGYGELIATIHES